MRKVIWGCLVFAFAASAEELRVPAQFATLQAAISASANGDSIVVAPGTYHEALNLQGKKITLRSSGGASVTFLDGTGGDASILTASKGESRATIVQGFTFRHGVGNLPIACDVAGRKGGAIFVLNSGISVIDCVFEDNGTLDAEGEESIVAGGAMFTCMGDIGVTGSRFDRNRASRGAGIEIINGARRTTVIERSTFHDNVSTGGSAISADLFSLSSMAVSDCVMERNEGAHAAAMYVRGANLARVTIERSTFRSNHARGSGGAMYALGIDSASTAVTGCRFEDNVAAHGAGVRMHMTNSARGAVVDSVFTNGYASFGGGASLSADSSAVIDVTGCDFIGQKAGFGGGLFAVARGDVPAVAGGRIRISGTRFLDNVSFVEPGTGIYNDLCFTDGRVPEASGQYFGGGADLRTVLGGSITVASSLFAGNSAMRAGGVHASTCAGGAIDLVNNTIADNAGSGMDLRLGFTPRPESQEIGTIRVANSIVRGNDADEIVVERFDMRTDATVTSSNVEGGFAGARNIDVPPSFLDPASRDYRLAEGSACIDAGDNEALDDAVNDADLARRPRIRGAGTDPSVDLGAYEYQPPSRRRSARP